MDQIESNDRIEGKSRSFMNRTFRAVFPTLSAYFELKSSDNAPRNHTTTIDVEELRRFNAKMRHRLGDVSHLPKVAGDDRTDHVDRNRSNVVRLHRD